MSDTPTPDLTAARVLELLDAATPGPWTVRLWHEQEDLVVWDVVSGKIEVAECTWSDNADPPKERARAYGDAALIALAPSLAARVVELEAEVERLAEMLETKG